MRVNSLLTDAPRQSQSPSDAYSRGQYYLRSCNYEAAEKALKQAIQEDARFAPSYCALGHCLRLQARAVEAESALRDALRLDPSMEEAGFSLAYLLHGQGRTADAGRLLLILAENNVGNLPLLHRTGTLLADLRCFEEAETLYAGIIGQEPSARSYLRLGEFRQKLGRYREAEQALSRAIELDPDMGAAYLLLAHTRRLTDQDTALVTRYKTALQNPALTTATRACLHFALGKMYDDLGDYPLAFHHIQEGNTLRRTEEPFQTAVWADYFGRLRTASAAPLPRCPLDRDDARIPVFIVGMLRSGTTLLERMLASLPRVCSLGEGDGIEVLANTAAAQTHTRYPECLAQLNEVALAGLARAHRQRWPERAGEAGWVVDKNPLNFLHLGLIARVFPQARIIHCRRHPLDTCLSVYFQNFAHPRNNYSYDLQDVAFFYRAYHDLMSHWRAALPQDMLFELEYENLVTHPETRLRTLLEYLGLQWNDHCLDFHRQPDSIATASVWQARQPLYTGAIGRWRHYLPQLQPLIQALGPELAQAT